VTVRDADHAAGVGVLGDDELAVRLHLGDRIADVEHRRDALPVGEVAAGHLRAALEEVPGGDAGGEAVPVVPRPAELVHQRREDERRVGGPAVTMMRAPPRSASTTGRALM
jgi:hypothetical protein